MKRIYALLISLSCGVLSLMAQHDTWTGVEKYVYEGDVNSVLSFTISCVYDSLGNESRDTIQKKTIRYFRDKQCESYDVVSYCHKNGERDSLLDFKRFNERGVLLRTQNKDYFGLDYEAIVSDDGTIQEGRYYRIRKRGKFCGNSVPIFDTDAQLSSCRYYDKEGRDTAWVYYDTLGNIESVTRKVYNKQGNLIESNYGTSRCVCSYDSKGRVVLDSSSSFIKRYEYYKRNLKSVYEYDRSAQKCGKIERYDRRGRKVFSYANSYMGEVTQIFDKQGKMIEERTSYRGCGPSETIKRFDDNSLSFIDYERRDYRNDTLICEYINVKNREKGKELITSFRAYEDSAIKGAMVYDTFFYATTFNQRGDTIQKSSSDRKEEFQLVDYFYNDWGGLDSIVAAKGKIYNSVYCSTWKIVNKYDEKRRLVENTTFKRRDGKYDEKVIWHYDADDHLYAKDSEAFGGRIKTHYRYDKHGNCVELITCRKNVLNQIMNQKITTYSYQYYDE